MTIPVGDAVLRGDLGRGPSPRGLVLFAHGTGSGRHSPRNRYVAGVLEEGRLATLLVDLLTPEEERLDTRTGELRFDVTMLAERLERILGWLAAQPGTSGQPLGLFGASTGGGAAIVAAARAPEVRAVVSRGGRPDLAGDALESVRVPTLLIVGGNDRQVLALNRDAYERLDCVKGLEVVAGASHLFEEPGALERVAALARDWFTRHLGARSPPSSG